MTTSEVERVIDLGDARANPPGGERPPARVRGVPVVAVLVALLTLGGAAVPPPTFSAVVPPAVLVASSFAVVGDRLYRSTSTDPRVEDATWTLSAHDLTDGRQLWYAPYDVPGGRIFDVVTAGPVLVVVGGATIGRLRSTAAFDARTGRPLWALAGEVVVASDRRTGVVLTGGPSPRLTGIDLADGRTLWTDAVTARTAVQPLAGRLLVVGRDGRVERRDHRTGEVERAAAPLRPGESPAAALTTAGVTLLWYVGPSGTGVAAIDPETLALRWRRDRPVDGGGFAPCGPQVCVSAGGGVDGLDPATGATVWHIDEARYVVELAGHLVALDSVPGGIGPVRTVAPGSGAPLADLRGWRTGDGGVLYRTRLGESGTTLAVLGPPAGALRPLAAVPEVVLSCQRGDTAVACRTPDGELRIWRLDAAELAFTRA
jgi:hypothetical protein